MAMDPLGRSFFHRYRDPKSLGIHGRFQNCVPSGYVNSFAIENSYEA